MSEKVRHIGPYSRPATLAKLDERTREARLLQSVRSELTAHLGGHPSAIERQLIERAAWLSLHVAQLDAKMAETGNMTEHDSRTYVLWSNTLTRTLARLGLKGAAQKPPDLAAYLAQKAAEKREPVAA